MSNIYSRGSEWRMWDLHLHTPSSFDYQDKAVTNEKIIQVLKENNISAVAITDHNVIDVDRIKDLKRIAGEDITIFPGIELRSNLGGSDLVHFTGIFPEDVNMDDLKKEVQVRLKIKDSDLSDKGDGDINKGHEKCFCEVGDIINTVKDLGGLVVVHAGSKSNSYENIKETLKDHYAPKIDILEIGKKEDESDYMSIVFPDVGKIFPMIICSDNHNANSYEPKEKCWIKADPSFEGLKQIIYEPKIGERVLVGPTKPDEKDEYRVISKIIFNSTDKFPKEILFNSNLCSVIGSRSSGKSALLAYTAHAIDKGFAEERMPDGPGAGISWDSVDFSHEVEWVNGLKNNESPGRIVYIPQNYLFKISNEPEEIKNRIEPLLFKLLPDFKNRYYTAQEAIKNHNINIEDNINEWFSNADKISSLINRTKLSGDKSAVQEEIKNIESKIEKIKKKFSLTEEDVKTYQQVIKNLKKTEERLKNIKFELSLIASQSENKPEDDNFFKRINFTTDPSLDNLPEILKDEISQKVGGYTVDALKEINRIVKSYKIKLEKELIELNENISKEKEKNKLLIEKNEKNKELQELVEKLNNQNILIQRIADIEKSKEETGKGLKTNEENIKSEIEKRESVLDRLLSYLQSLDQHDFDIVFGLEYHLDDNFLETLARKINKAETSDFFEKGKIKLEEIRKKSANFVKKIYSGEQKINLGYEKKNVVKEALTLTEKILFTAEMEGDHIGGFERSTMTAGKQALFALKLILGESDDKWPLLIDQPEDDLDSRSIYDHIVPFLKKKKKERQIIMVSHNANLVVGADSEQIIVSNRNGDDWPNEDQKEFNYISGSIESTKDKDEASLDTLKSQGIREHACDILDGGRSAFEHRRNKYNLVKI